MPYLIGTDEAGYGPNLGPLVISASVWWVDEPTTGYDLYARLRGVVGKSTPAKGANRRVAIADSKALYSPALGLSVLERGVLAALGLIDRCPGDWLDVWQMLDADSLAHLPSMPWHLDYDLRLPLAADADDLVQLLPKLRRGFERAGVRLVALQSRAVFPERFNHAADQFGNKSETLSKTTLALVADVLGHCAGEPVKIVCDKHGGRNYYGRLLQQQFPDPLVEVCVEGSAQSIYRWGPPEERIEVCFRTGGEEFMPAALASMASKYLRELSMRAFNDFWCGRVRDLSPTAGYPRDARRFKAAIRDEQSALGIDDRILWRNRPARFRPQAPRGVTPMLLYIVRHAFAGQHGDPRYPDDALRPLTKKGCKQFRRLMKRLVRRGVAPRLVATSPLVRCRQTAEIMRDRVGSQAELVALDSLAPGSQLESLIAWSNEQGVEELAWVGHAPDVDRLAADLVGARDGSIVFAKAAVAALEFDDEIVLGQGTLRWHVSPKVLGC